MKKKNESTSEFVACIDNKGYPESLELHKICRVVPDKDAAGDEDLRIIDESGENYLLSLARIKSAAFMSNSHVFQSTYLIQTT